MLGVKLLFLFVFPVVLARRNYTYNNVVQDAEELSGYYEGDMMLSRRQVKDLRSRNGLRSDKYHWPDAKVPYKLSSKLSEPQQKHIKRALDIIQKVSCVKFHKKEKSDKNYVYVTNVNIGCCSKVGFGRGKRVVNLHGNELDKDCFRIGTIMHEFLHVLGFYHMHSSADRDDYINIVWKNIRSDTKDNFKKWSDVNVTRFGEKYDYDSVLHYKKDAFSKNGLPTIIPKDPTAKIGQRTHLSTGDIKRLNKMYKCEIKNKKQ